MRILFTRSEKIVSKLIRRVTGEPVSHCAIQVGDWVIHSNFLGVHPERIDKFLKGGVTIWAAVELPNDYPKILLNTFEGWGKRYDFGAMFYLLARAIFPWLPKKNLWQCSDMFLCSEWVAHVVEDDDDAMITPYRLAMRLLEQKAPVG